MMPVFRFMAMVLTPLSTIFQLHHGVLLLSLAEDTGVPGENHRPAASHWQTLSHNVVSSKPHNERGSKSQYMWWTQLYGNKYK